ncbi:MAG: hypothetical protein ACRDHG_10440 [Anaerolineales bacterium]
MVQPDLVGSSVYIDPSCRFGEGCRVGHCSLVGHPIEKRSGIKPQGSTRIGAGTEIGAYCIIEDGAQIGERVVLDHYVRIGGNAVIGNDSYVLYGARIHRNVRIGARCRISGNCPDGTLIEDDVTHFGRIHHKYENPWGGWESTEELSPRIQKETVIAAGSIVVGPIVIGERCFIAAGEVVRRSVPSWSVYYKGNIIPAKDWTGSLATTFFGVRHGDRP